MIGMMAIMGGSGRAIEAQEKNGQAELCRSAQLPIKSNTYPKIDVDAVLKSWGVELEQPTPADPLFRQCKLPPGWLIKPTDHSMWSSLVDGDGRKRASIFYKAAFYDRDAFINLDARYSIDSWTGFEPELDESRQAIVKDGDAVLFTSDAFPCKPGDVRSTYAARDLAYEQCKKWLNDNYPGWEDPSKYWPG